MYELRGATAPEIPKVGRSVGHSVVVARFAVAAGLLGVSLVALSYVYWQMRCCFLTKQKPFFQIRTKGRDLLLDRFIVFRLKSSQPETLEDPFLPSFVSGDVEQLGSDTFWHISTQTLSPYQSTYRQMLLDDDRDEPRFCPNEIKLLAIGLCLSFICHTRRPCAHARVFVYTSMGRFSKILSFCSSYALADCSSDCHFWDFFKCFWI